MKKSAFYLLPLSGFLAGVAFYIFQKSQTPLDITGKNIILISIDTLRADHLGLYGYHRNTAPNIDKLGRQSIVFEQAFSAASYTLASHTSLFTGVYPKTHKVYIKHNEDETRQKKTKLLPHIKTLAEFLSRIGYHTILAVHSNFEHLNFNDSEGRGFQTHFRPLEHSLPEFKNWILKNSGQLFFAVLHSYHVHDPYNHFHDSHIDKSLKRFTSTDYKGNIPETKKELVDMFQKKHGEKINCAFGHEHFEHKKRATVNFCPLSVYTKLRNFFWRLVDKNNPKDIQRLKDMYDDMILFTDQYIGQLLLILTDLNILENTVIILISDNGETFGEHGHFNHMKTYKEELHVPLIIRIPGVSPKRVKSFVSLIDVYPTLLDLLQKKPPHKMEGLSLKPLIMGDDKQLHDFIFAESASHKDISVSNGEWKLIRWQNGERELYHVRKDPEEKTQVSPLEHLDIYKLLDYQIDIFLEK